MKKNTLSSEIKPISVKNNILVQELEKELLLYDLHRNRAFCLNETSLIIWNLCNGQNTVEDIRRNVSIQLKAPITEELIWFALNDLKNEQLIDNYQNINISFNGLSRREVIKKIGLSTMVALPLISAIVSPKAVAAQSQVCLSSDCICEDLTCLQLGPVALIQSPCLNAGCSGIGGNNCLCAGPFFCLGVGERFGACRLV